MSASPNPPGAAAPPPSAKPAKPRSPVEKLIVRGGILLLIVLAAVQAHARFGYSLTLQKLQARVSADDTATGESVKIGDLSSFVVGWPSRTEKFQGNYGTLTYTWRGLTESYPIHLEFDKEDKPPVVLAIYTADPPKEPEKVLAESPGERSGLASMGGGGGGGPSPTPGTAHGQGSGGGGGGRGGGQQRPDIMTYDSDGDGKVSKEDVPEERRQFFDRMDENKDGFIDTAEAAAAAQRRAARAAAGGSGGGGGAEGRPRAADGQPPASETPQTPAEPPASATVPANNN